MRPICDNYLTKLVEIEKKLLIGNDLHSCYSQILEQVGQVTSAFRSYVIEVIDDTVNLFSGSIAEWSAVPNRGSAPYSTDHPISPPDWQTSLDASTIASWKETLGQGEIVVARLPVLPVRQSECPEGQPPLIDSWTIVLLPLRVQGKLYGAIGLEGWQETAQNASAPDTLKLNVLSLNSLKLNALRLSPAICQLLQGVAVALSFKLEQFHHQTQLKTLSQQVQQLQNELKEVAQRHTFQLQKSLDFEALLRRITDRVRDSLDKQQILQAAVQELATGLGQYSCDTALYDLEQGISIITCEYLNCEELLPAKGLSFHQSDYPEMYAQLLSGQYVQFCWIDPSINVRAIKKRFAVLSCPIRDDQGVIGDLWIHGDADTCFETDVVRLVEQVANQCAIALRQARLYHESQTQVQKLEHLNYLKDDFLNTVSHELRSPMVNIEMAIQMLDLLLFQTPPGDGANPVDTDPISTNHKACLASAIESSSFPPILPERPSQTKPPVALPAPSAFQQALRYFRMLQDECIRETNLINNLLDLSRLEAKTEPIFLTSIQLQIWIPHVVEPFLERAYNQQQHLQIDIADPLPPLSTDLSGLERILSELLHNACKYTPAGGTIRISAELGTIDCPPLVSTSGYLVLNPLLEYPTSPLEFDPPPVAKKLLLRISNSGVEIPPSELPRIFDKFYRIPSNDSWKQGGTGLGLALVQRLVEHLGATIEVESSNNQVMFTVAFAISLNNPAQNPV
jgi:signal transduction histidine kinase